jgi:SAM-dependent methyltransferase
VTEQLNAEVYRAFDTPPDNAVAFLLAFAENKRLPVNCQVLDLGCGPGRFLLPLADLEWRVDGIEPDPSYAAAAKAIAAGKAGVSVFYGTLDRYETDTRYDLCILMNSVLPYWVDDGERRHVLAKIRSLLRPGGWLVADLPNHEWILENYRPPTPIQRGMGRLTVELERTHEIDTGTRRFVRRDRVFQVKDGKRADVLESRRHEHVMRSRDEYADDLRRAGYADVEVFASWEDREAGGSLTHRLILAAR